MYKGHFILLGALISILFITFIISKNKKRAFAYVSFGISIIFFLVSIKYYYDVYIYNPTLEGFEMTKTMYFLVQNEDFVLRNGKVFGLFWGGGIAIISLILGMFLKPRRRYMFYNASRRRREKLWD